MGEKCERCGSATGTVIPMKLFRDAPTKHLHRSSDGCITALRAKVDGLRELLGEALTDQEVYSTLSDDTVRRIAAAIKEE